MKGEFHGSDLDPEAIAREYHITGEELKKIGSFVSFAANVNPLGIPESFREKMSEKLDCITRYPERDYASLREAVGRYAGVSAEHVLVGNGSTELIAGIIRHFRHPRALMVEPAYSEYHRAVELAEGRTDSFFLREEEDFRFIPERLADAVGEEHDLLILCNPVNPTSSVLDRDGLRLILEKCRRTGTLLFTDETYIEFAGVRTYGAEPLIGEYENLYIIRSMSKFFSAPGLRLGYALTSDQKLREKILSEQDPWSVSSFAEEAGKLLLSDTDFQERSARYLSEERSRVCKALDELSPYGLKYYRPYANFVLCRFPDRVEQGASRLFGRCIRRGMMIRNAASFEGLTEQFFRFCFMRKEDDDRLLEAIREELQP